MCVTCAVRARLALTGSLIAPDHELRDIDPHRTLTLCRGLMWLDEGSRAVDLPDRSTEDFAPDRAFVRVYELLSATHLPTSYGSPYPDATSRKQW